jgi:hypothetical protein
VQSLQAAAVITQRIINVILADGVGEFGIHQNNGITDRTESPRLFINLMPHGQLGDKISQDELEKLINDD